MPGRLLILTPGETLLPRYARELLEGRLRQGLCRHAPHPLRSPWPGRGRYATLVRGGRERGRASR